MSASRHRFPELLYFREGKGKIRIEFPQRHEVYSCRAGECVIVPAEVDHSIEDNPIQPLSLYGLSLDPSKIVVCAGLSELLPGGKIPQQKVVLLDVENRLRRLLFLAYSDSPAGKLSAVALAIDLFASIVQSKPVDRKRKPASAKPGEIQEYVEWLRSNFYEPVTLDEAAEACGFSRRKFTEQFKQQTGTTWLNYLHRLRIAHATKLLTETDAQVTSIAFQCGFEELSTFYRLYRKRYGCAPGKTRLSN